MYKFKVDYWRNGWSFINQVDKVAVRQFRHDEFDRFIQTAFPYYATVFSIIGLFALFVLGFLYSKN